VREPTKGITLMEGRNRRTSGRGNRGSGPAGGPARVPSGLSPRSGGGAMEPPDPPRVIRLPHPDDRLSSGRSNRALICILPVSAHGGSHMPPSSTVAVTNARS
jgi:hypothetical protein